MSQRDRVLDTLAYGEGYTDDRWCEACSTFGPHTVQDLGPCAGLRTHHKCGTTWCWDTVQNPHACWRVTNDAR